MIVAKSSMMNARRFRHIPSTTMFRKILWSIRVVPMGVRFDSGSAAHIALFAIMAMALGMDEVQPDNQTLAGVTLTLAFALFVGVQALHSYLAWTSLVHTVAFRPERQRHMRFIDAGHKEGYVNDDQFAEAQRILSRGSRFLGPALTSISHDERIAYQEGQAEGRAHFDAMMESK